MLATTTQTANQVKLMRIAIAVMASFRRRESWRMFRSKFLIESMALSRQVDPRVQTSSQPSPGCSAHDKGKEESWSIIAWAEITVNRPGDCGWNCYQAGRRGRCACPGGTGRRRSPLSRRAVSFCKQGSLRRAAGGDDGLAVTWCAQATRSSARPVGGQAATL